MKALVLKPCIDKKTGEFYPEGAIIEIAPERVKKSPEYLKAIKEKKKKG